MTVFLTPNQEPIFAGTYFPPTDRWGRPGFSTILQKISEGWAQHREDIVKQASSFTSRLQISLQGDLHQVFLRSRLFLFYRL